MTVTNEEVVVHVRSASSDFQKGAHSSLWQGVQGVGVKYVRTGRAAGSVGDACSTYCLPKLAY